MSTSSHLDLFRTAKRSMYSGTKRITLLTWSLGQAFMADRLTGKSLIRDYHEYLDYGIILKINPAQFPGRTWIACAGMGEFGTSGAAWFLSKKWPELERLAQGAGSFFALLAVEPGKDESAVLVNFGSGTGSTNFR